MELLVSITTVLGALALGTISPGPSFVFVARTAVAKSRPDGIAAAFGMGVGGVIFAGLALLGLQAAIAAMPGLFTGLKVLGALYLIYLGWGAWRGAREPLAVNERGQPAPRAVGGSFRQGLLTQLSNPKAAVVYGSVFAALLPAHPPAWAAVVLLGVIFAMETGWYAFVAVTLSAEASRAVYLRSKALIDRSAGGVMALLGLKLLIDARSSMM
ncbi:LysE family translocator [Opitutus terrae]|uniref:Lysine exporter protein (LYSE/YGGA) n=1 Tax=Opitutus terrae (strain DSM 11246 / JCM 15787 / PB90-1) TaxID=452637 RepID=B1ZSR6_OPITP|nr:LysE family transporter [Opitutus terrae]ACB74760.1 Lysine exporter protein (LYSE/YGGA) [Opitutus terrae PB90-1]